jgi:hypothetical protein
MYNFTKVNPELKPPKLEIIKWLDHAVTPIAGWQHIPDMMDLQPCTIVSVGWVLREDKDSLLIVPTVDRGYGTSMQSTTIVKKAILKRWKLNDPSTPRPKRKVNRTK